MSSGSLCVVLALFLLVAELQHSSCQPESAMGQRGNSSQPVSYPATIVEGGEQVCPPEAEQQIIRANIEQDVRNIIREVLLCRGLQQENPASSCLEVSLCSPQLPSDYYWLTSSDGAAVQVYCDMDRVCSCSSSSASVGGWSRVAFLNMSDPTHQCPPAWMEVIQPVRTCRRTNQTLVHPFYLTPNILRGGCSSAFFSAHGISYSHVCGRIVGYHFGSVGGFQAFQEGWYTRIEDPYVDGVVITQRTEKQHIWTFATSRDVGIGSNPEACPCSDPAGSQTVPPFVGEDYFCESGTEGMNSGQFFLGDPLWDGENCRAPSTCCELNSPPYFCKTLAEPAADDIEVRICADEETANEGSPIELIEIFVQ